MFRAAAAAALRKNSGQRQRRPAKTDSSNRPEANLLGDGFLNLERLEYPVSSFKESKRTPKVSRSIPFDPEKAFRVKFSKLNSENEECVYYKDDEDRFTQQ